MNRMLLGYSPDFDVFDDEPAVPLAPRVRAQARRERESEEIDAAERATELLEVSGRPGLPAFLAHLVRRAARSAGGTLDAALEAELVHLLQRAAPHALPTLPTRAPDATARASRFFGIELEGLSAEDQEFESARRFVQLAGEAARAAAFTAPRLPPRAAAWRAATQAARRRAPGWVCAMASAASAARRSPSFARAGGATARGPGVIGLNH